MTSVDVQNRTAGRLMSSLREPLPRTRDWGLLAGVVVVLNLFGLLMVFSASSVNSMGVFAKQAIYLALGGLAVWIFGRIDHRVLRRYVMGLVAFSLATMVLVLVPGFGVSVNGSARWLGWGPIRVQPSEFAKLAVILYAADLLARRRDRMGDWKASLRPVMVMFLLFAGLLMMQPNLGTTIILATIVLMMLFVAGVPTRALAATGALLVGAATAFAFLEPYRMRRLMAFTDPWADPLNRGFQTIQSQVGIANGGIFGVGLGQGRAKWGFLPEAHTDFIFAIVSEELGLVGAAFVVSLFVVFAYAGARTVLRSSDRFGMLVATGVVTWILVQAIINIGAVVGVLPITGVPLPFVSAGGSSLVVTMAAYGILLNIARQER